MYSALSPGAISVAAPNLESAIAAALEGGFAGVEISPSEIADRLERESAADLQGLFQKAGIKPSGWGLPTPWRGSEADWKVGLADLPRLAAACAAIGCTRTFTWIMPMSDELDFEANSRFHIDRLKPAVEILAEHGCTFGMEFIGPKTLRDKGKYPFVYRSGQMLELAARIGPNVGLLLDCWHWYTSGGTVEEIEAMHPDQIVYVHVNDAPTGIDRDEQVDNTRCLPGETGVIDIKSFLGALRKIDYDGPVVPEPFKNELKELASDGERLKMVGAAMRSIGL